MMGFLMILVVLAVVGLAVGTQVNRAIYDWAWFVEVSPSPFACKPRMMLSKFWDYVPVLPWFSRRNLSGKSLYPSAVEGASPEDLEFIPALGQLFWFRATCIELLCGIGLPLLYWWYQSGGLTGHAQHLNLLAGENTTIWVWFVFHSLLLTLMLIGAVIDWDEKTIPDQVTVTGIVIAAVVLVAWPNASLPELNYNGIKLDSITPYNFFSPRDVEPWHLQPLGFLAVLIAWTFWACLVVPSLWTLRYGPAAALKFAIASVLQPTRKRSNTIASRKRSIHTVTKITFAIWVVAMIATLWLWNEAGPRWLSFFSLSCSMALAGLGTWLVRILAGWAVGNEALGFGDVTLMFMIGAAFGWQFALLVFVLAPFLSIGYAIFNYVMTGESALAFGPWLCAAAGILLIFWNPIWNDFTSRQIFGIGPALLLIIAACLLLLPVILSLLLLLKRLFGLA